MLALVSLCSSEESLGQQQAPRQGLGTGKWWWYSAGGGERTVQHLGDAMRHTGWSAYIGRDHPNASALTWATTV
eukprot:scaffold1298_cov382-Prasinococcus_capsulatus_cf.AAC.20